MFEFSLSTIVDTIWSSDSEEESDCWLSCELCDDILSFPFSNHAIGTDSYSTVSVTGALVSNTLSRLRFKNIVLHAAIATPRQC